jgi:predicted pyridoxine 5'-phosphate oxidase superfamily flavin-nucleotide-binding protein
VGDIYDAIDEKLQRFIEAQHVFFVATAPRDGHVNLSPKGLDSFRVLGPQQVAYIDFIGSGAETIAHLRENGRITIMLCSFEGPPKILRLHGTGEVIEPQDEAFEELALNFTTDMTPRSIIRVDVERISDSCGYGVPVMTFEAERTLLRQWADKKGEAKLTQYQKDMNAASIDGLPALRWVEQT